MRGLIQLAFDFLDSSANSGSKMPVKAVNTGDFAPESGAIKPPAQPAPAQPQAPTARLADVLQPATYRHPRATRETMLGDTLVAFELRRAKRRTIGFVVGPEGLVVSAPKWVPLYEVDAALREKSAWVVRKLGESEQRQQRLQAARIEWRDGAELPYLGQTLTLVLDPRHDFRGAGAQLQADGTDRLNLRLGLPDHATAEQIRDSVQAWLMREAKRIFTERMTHFAPLLGVQWRKLSLSSAGTRWGSASADGSIRLNWRLIHYKLSVIDYVVAHELSHLRVMDHSPRFWDTVASIMPDYAQLRRELKDDVVPKWE